MIFLESEVTNIAGLMDKRQPRKEILELMTFKTLSQKRKSLSYPQEQVE